MKEELKSGIEEFDNIIEKYENGEIDFVALTDRLWNEGYKAGRQEALQKYVYLDNDQITITDV